MRLQRFIFKMEKSAGLMTGVTSLFVLFLSLGLKFIADKW